MKHVFTLSLLAVFMLAFSLNAQDFTRLTPIGVPETNLNNGGWGNMISGVDIDGDGKTEIYLVNDNWNDGPTEVIPRIYKLELDAGVWNVVWSAVAPIEYQNTWPQLELADLDKDGKPELLWTPINAGTANPYRLLAYEYAGDGSDVFGIATEETHTNGEAYGYEPNSAWTIADADGVNLRPMDMVIADPDGDETMEVCIADRTGNNDGHYFIVASVDNIPDNGDGSETWTMEVSGKDFGDLTAQPIENKWSVAVIGANVYTFCEVEISKLTWTGAAWTYTDLAPLVGGGAVQSAQVVDLDNDGTEEILCTAYDWGDDAEKGVYLLQEDGDTLKHTQLFNVSSAWSTGSRGPWGSTVGDIDRDGYLDYVFGSRAGDVNATIHRVAYRGGDITDPANYELVLIDSEFADGGIWSIINLANIDDDPELEVLYTSSTDAGTFPSTGSQPIVVLDYTGEVGIDFDNLIVAPEVLLNGETPAGLTFKPGRVLDDGTIWFCGMDNSARQTYVFRSVDGGAIFTHNTTPIEGRAAQMDAFDADIAIVSTANGKIFRTTDGGANWTEVHSYMGSPLGSGWFNACRVLNETTAVCVGDMETVGDMHFVRSTDQGATWTEIEGIDYLNASYGYYTFGLGACNVGESMWYAGLTSAYDSAYVFRSYDAGATWESFHIPSEVTPKYGRSIAFVNDNDGMISGRYGAVIKTTDGGATWTATNNPDTSSSSWVNGVMHIPGTNIIIAADDIGVYATTDLGETWMQLETPVETESDYHIAGLFGSTDLGFIFTDNGLVLRFEDQLTGIIDKLNNVVITDYQLLQNYPNPFNPTTKISFLMPRAADVKVVVYNMLGQKVQTLFDGHRSAGVHTLNWNGQNEFGQTVASGTYIYKLVGKDVNISKRMVFIK